MTAFVVLTFCLLVGALVFEVSALFYAFYICVGVYAWSRWHTPRALQQISVARHFPANAFLGETVPIKVTVNNRGKFALPWLRVQEGLPWELRSGAGLNEVIALPARQSTVLHYPVRTRRRGLYRIGPLFVASGDLFGFFPDQVVSESLDHITVYPRINHITKLRIPSRLPFGTLASKKRLFSDPLRPAGIRDYQSGDSLRQINWKATGHTGALKVKTVQPAMSLESVIALNAYPDDFDLLNWHDGVEWGIELAASLAGYLIPKKQAVGLITNGMDPLAAPGERSFDATTGRLHSVPGTRAERLAAPISPRTGRAQLMRILELLARLEGARNTQFVDWLGRACLSLSWGVSVFIVTPTCDDRMCQRIARLARGGLNPILIVTEPVHFAPIRERAHRLGFMSLQIRNRHDLENWQNTQKAAG